MSSEISVNHHSGDHRAMQHEAPLQEIAPAPSAETAGHTSINSTAQPPQGLTSLATTVTAAEAVAAAMAAGRDMKNFSDMEINELLGLIPDEYTAQQEAEEAAATAAANAASALGKGVHHNVTVTSQSVPSNIGQIPNNGTATKHHNSGMNTSASQEAQIAAQEAELRSQRKRSREKQRRNDVNKQFAELTEVLKTIEREAQEIGRKDDAYGSVSTMMAIAATTGPTNRVDLIARTIVHLERLNRTAKKQRAEIANLQEQLERTKEAGEDMAERLKDLMFTQQRQFSVPPFPTYQNLTTSLATTASAPAVPAPTSSHVPTTNTAPQQTVTQQQMPMMMMPVMMPPQTTPAPGSSSGTQQQPQHQFMMVMPHPGSQMAMPGQPFRQMMQPVATVQQPQQPASHAVPPPVPQAVQQPVTQQQTYVSQQLQQQQSQPQQITPATQDLRGQGNSSTGENLAHAA